MKSDGGPLLDYARPVNHGWRFWFEPTLAWALVVVVWIFAAVVVVPEFETAYHYGKFRLPDLTWRVTVFARWVRASYGWAYLSGFFLLFVLMMGRVPQNPGEQRPTVVTQALISGILALAFSAMLLLWAMVLPFMTVLWSLSGGAAVK